MGREGLISGSEYARVLNLFWEQLINNFKFKYSGETLKNKICSKCIFDLKPEFFFQLWTIFISCEFLERLWEIMRHPWYCLAHHPGISSIITSVTHFITPSTPPTVAYQPPYPRWHNTNGLSPIIMNEVFNFLENKRYNLRSGIYLASRNMHTARFVTDAISSLGPKLWKLMPDKIKHASTLSTFKAKINSWTINNCPCRLCKIFVKDLGFVEVCPSLYWNPR